MLICFRFINIILKLVKFGYKNLNKTLENKLQSLMKQAQKGNKTSYKSLLEELNNLATSYIRKRINSETSVEDIVQEILVSIHKSRHTYDPEKPFLPWFYAIAKFRLNDYLRNFYSNKEDLSFEGTFENVISQTTELRDIEKTQMIEKSLDCLSSKKKKIIKLMYIDGYSVREVSEKMSISLSDVKVSAHRALKEIKTNFGGDYEN